MKIRINNRTLVTLGFAVAMFFLHSVYSTFAGDVLVAPQDFKQVAQIFATVKYNGIVDDGIPYYSLDDEIVSWVFTVYKGTGAFPTNDEIKDSVFDAYESRRQAEAQYQAALNAGDEAGAEYARKLMENYWANMRNGENFSTIFVMGDSTAAFIGCSSHYRDRKERQAIQTLAFFATSAVKYFLTVDAQAKIGL